MRAERAQPGARSGARARRRRPSCRASRPRASRSPRSSAPSRSPRSRRSCCASTPRRSPRSSSRTSRATRGTTRCAVRPISSTPTTDEPPRTYPPAAHACGPRAGDRPLLQLARHPRLVSAGHGPFRLGREPQRAQRRARHARRIAPLGVHRRLRAQARGQRGRLGLAPLRLAARDGQHPAGAARVGSQDAGLVARRAGRARRCRHLGRPQGEPAARRPCHAIRGRRPIRQLAPEPLLDP